MTIISAVTPKLIIVLLHFTSKIIFSNGTSNDGYFLPTDLIEKKSGQDLGQNLVNMSRIRPSLTAVEILLRKSQVKEEDSMGFSKK